MKAGWQAHWASHLAHRAWCPSQVTLAHCTLHRNQMASACWAFYTTARWHWPTALFIWLTGLYVTARRQAHWNSFSYSQVKKSKKHQMPGQHNPFIAHQYHLHDTCINTSICTKLDFEQLEKHETLSPKTSKCALKNQTNQQKLNNSVEQKQKCDYSESVLHPKPHTNHN